MSVFDWIAPVYGLFYARQIRRFTAVTAALGDTAGLSPGMSVLDVGCGTGALCAVLARRGLKPSGVDPSLRMLGIAQKKNSDPSVRFVQASALEPLPFEPKSFDICVASYVAHGLNAADRKTLYAQMSRVTKHTVIIYDYNEKRAPLTSFIERLEGGDYFNFIKQAKAEMEEQFGSVRILNAGPRASWYLLTPKDI